MTFNTGLKLGVDFTKTYTDGLTPFQPGETQTRDDGVVFMHVKFTAAKTAGLCYIIDKDYIVQTGVVTSDATSAPLKLGTFQTSTTAPDSGVTYSWGWIAIEGPFQMWGTQSGAGAAANSELFTTSNIGQLFSSNISGTAAQVHGVKFTTAVTAFSTMTNAFAAVPMYIPTT